jgi:hypothetical protein
MAYEFSELIANCARVIAPDESPTKNGALADPIVRTTKQAKPFFCRQVFCPKTVTGMELIPPGDVAFVSGLITGVGQNG